jgi:hypothetical protein
MEKSLSQKEMIKWIRTPIHLLLLIYDVDDINSTKDESGWNYLHYLFSLSTSFYHEINEDHSEIILNELKIALQEQSKDSINYVYEKHQSGKEIKAQFDYKVNLEAENQIDIHPVVVNSYYIGNPTPLHLLPFYHSAQKTRFSNSNVGSSSNLPLERNLLEKIPEELWLTSDSVGMTPFVYALQYNLNHFIMWYLEKDIPILNDKLNHKFDTFMRWINNKSNGYNKELFSKVKARIEKERLNEIVANPKDNLHDNVNLVHEERVKKI